MRIRTAVIFGAVLMVLGCTDRMLKLFALRVIPAEGLFVFDQAVGIRLEYNTGIAYGLMIGRPVLVIVLISGAVLALSAVAVRLGLQRQWGQVVAVASMIIGALSNLIDRIHYGAVVDYFNIAGMPRFNLADMMIAGGVIMWLTVWWRRQLDVPARVS